MTKTIAKPPVPRRCCQQAALAAMILALLPGAAAAESAARVTFAYGPVAAIASDGARRALARNAAIDAGDTISTGSGRAQLRFTDGSFVSLKPDTQFRVDEYAFKGRGDTQQRGFFSLLRGGLRTITGLIGRTRKASYRMRTSVATIGIRGTQYNLDLSATANGEPLLTWNVVDDGTSAISVVLSDGTERVFTWGGTGSATREQFEQLVKALQQLADQGRLQGITRDELLAIFAAGDVVNAQGLAVQLASPVAPPPDCATAVPGCAIAGAFGATFDGEGLEEIAGVFIDGGEGNLAALFDPATGALLSYQTSGDRLEVPLADGGTDLNTNAQIGTARAVVDGSAFFSVDPANRFDPRAAATWGRWIAPLGVNGESTGDDPHSLVFRNGTQDTFAYVISIPPAQTFNQGSAQYTLTGFTPPAVLGGGAVALGAPGTVNGTLTANFGAGQVALNMNVPFANGSYRLSSTDLVMFAITPAFVGQGQPFFKGSPNVTGVGVACPGAACTGFVSGNLFGPRADGAALGYHIKDPELSSSNVTGAAVFQQQNCVGCGFGGGR